MPTPPPGPAMPARPALGPPPQSCPAAAPGNHLPRVPAPALQTPFAAAHESQAAHRRPECRSSAAPAVPDRRTSPAHAAAAPAPRPARATPAAPPPTARRSRSPNARRPSVSAQTRRRYPPPRHADRLRKTPRTTGPKAHEPRSAQHPRQIYRATAGLPPGGPAPGRGPASGHPYSARAMAWYSGRPIAMLNGNVIATEHVRQNPACASGNASRTAAGAAM